MSTETMIYFSHGDIVAQSGLVKVYEMEDELFLEVGPGHNLWALESEFKDYMNQFKQLSPKGNCLEIGLGLGVASRCIMTFPKVKHLTTVELNKDVITTHDATIHILDDRVDKWESYHYEKHLKINDNGLNYLLTTDKKFDFIFLDFYKAIDEESIPEIKDMVNAAKKCTTTNGIVMGWLDPYTQAGDYKVFEKIFST